MARQGSLLRNYQITMLEQIVRLVDYSLRGRCKHKLIDQTVVRRSRLEQIFCE
jgi:hypothetical protein